MYSLIEKYILIWKKKLQSSTSNELFLYSNKILKQYIIVLVCLYYLYKIIKICLGFTLYFNSKYLHCNIDQKYGFNIFINILL